MELNLEIGKAVEEIKKSKANTVLLQLPDGLKAKADKIIDMISKEVDVDITIWSGSCYGACDTPNVTGYDVMLQFGHSLWVK